MDALFSWMLQLWCLYTGCPEENSEDIKTSINISLGVIPGPSPWARTKLGWSKHWCCAGPFSVINSSWEPPWAELYLSSKPCFSMQMSPNPSFNLGISALTEEVNTALWIPPPARLGPGCYPGSDAFDPSELGERHPHIVLQSWFPLFHLPAWWLRLWPAAAQAVFAVLCWTPLLKGNIAAHFVLPGT